MRTPGKQFAAGGGAARIPFDQGLVVTDQPSVIVDAIERAGSRVTAFLVTRTCEKLIDSTPVDTGYARACWIISVGSRSSLTGGSPGSVSEAPQQLGLIKMATYHVRQGQAFITNNAKYIMRLNAGHSQKAPIGFIQLAVDGALTEANIAFRAGL